jgi:carboxypeptidase T
MRPFIRLLPVLALLAALLAAPAGAANPSLVRVALDSRVTLDRILEAGLDVVGVRAGASVDVLAWPGDEARLAALGVRVTVVDADPGLHAARRADAELAARGAVGAKRVWSAARGDGRFRAEALPPAGSGSLGGYWTLAEVKMKLDDLVAGDALGVVADRIDTLGYTVQGRPVWGLAVGTTVTGTDTRPVAFFSALTHAREPGGMQALFNFVDDLVAKYPADPVAKYLLENRRIYIVPAANPDGYEYNRRIKDSTGTFGLWRKNLRDNNGNHVTDANDGVDLNRNFGYQWGYDNSGSSGTPSSLSYRGPSAWSEPETRIQRDVFAALKPVCGFSFHTYSNLFVHPWGWTTVGTPDSARFQAWSDEFSLTNGFVAGPGPRILYAVNGEFSDWTYGDTLLKPRAFTWTPEVGGSDDGFWPPPSRMAAISETVLRPCWQVAGIAGPWVRVEHAELLEGSLAAGNAAHLVVRARNVGASGQAGPGLLATLTPLDAELFVRSGPLTYPALGSFASADADLGASFVVAASDTVTPGRLLRFRVDFTDDAGLYCRDTVEVVVGVPTTVLVDACQSLAGWTLTSGSWAVKSNDPNHPSAYIADSPSGAYPSNYTGQLRLTTPLDLSHGVHAWAFFDDRYAFEQEFDAGLFETSLDGTTWTARGGNGAVSSPAVSIAGAGKPVFGGTRWRWRADRVDLSPVAGATAVRLRWRSLSDAGANFDGMNFDSLRVYVYDPAMQPAPAAVGEGPAPARLTFAPPVPNPARGVVTLSFATPEAGPITLEVLDVQGRTVRARHETLAYAASGAPRATHFAWNWDLRDGSGRRVAPGLYLVRLATAHDAVTRRVIVLP